MNPMSMAERVRQLQPTAVNRILHEARQLQAEGRTLVSLARGQPDFATPLPIVAAAQTALRAGRTGYPDNRGEPELRRAVADRLAADWGQSYDPDQEILITDGATCGIAAALAVLVQAGDDVLLPDPIYDAYASVISLWGGRPVPIPAVIQAGRFTLEPAALQAACSPRAKVLLLNNPWNPVGTVFRRDELRAIVDVVLSQGLAIISDEIYHAQIHDGQRHVSPVQLSAEARARTVLVNSLSKTYAMTGWRVGYCAAPAAVIQAMFLVLQQFSRGPATFAQDAAAFALRMDQALVQPMVAELQARRDQVVRALSDLPGIMPLTPEGGLFVMVDIRQLGLSSDAARRWLLREAGVVVIHGAAYGPGGEGTLRVSFAAGGSTLAEGMCRLREGLRRLQATS
ncbi:MAG: pyridoxal phosphate-dependent aminotransferase [Gemmataceae bacterium]